MKLRYTDSVTLKTYPLLFAFLFTFSFFISVFLPMVSMQLLYITYVFFI